MFSILVKKKFDVACCKAKGVPHECLVLCEPPDSSSTFRNNPKFMPRRCDTYEDLIDDQCIVAFTRHGNFKLHY